MTDKQKPKQDNGLRNFTLTATGIGVAGGFIKGGSIGVAAFGGAIGLPLAVAGGLVCMPIGVGSYYAYKAYKKKKQK